MIGKVLLHNYGQRNEEEDEKFQNASQLYIEISSFAHALTQEADSGDFLSLSPPLALTFSALYMLCKPYSRLGNNHDGIELSFSEAAMTMKNQALDGIRTVSSSIVEFSKKLVAAVHAPEDLARVSPVIMESLYAAATNYAWVLRENGDKESQHALDTLRQCLRRLGTKWRGATEYLKILEAQEVSLWLLSSERFPCPSALPSSETLYSSLTW